MIIVYINNSVEQMMYGHFRLNYFPRIDRIKKLRSDDKFDRVLHTQVYYITIIIFSRIFIQIFF